MLFPFFCMGGNSKEQMIIFVLSIIPNHNHLIAMKEGNNKKFPWSDFWAIICGVICLLQGAYFCMMIVHYYQWRNGVMWEFVDPYWYTIPQFLLCLAGIVLTIRRFIRKKKGLAFKEDEWIPLIVSYVFCPVYQFLIVPLLYY